MQNKIFNAIVMTLSVGVFLAFFIFSDGYNLLIKHFKTLNGIWLFYAFLCMVVFWFFETIILYIITKALYKVPNLFIKSLKFSMVGQFFGAITPFNSGSQPSELYSMAENGIPVGPAGSILMIKFIIHEIILTLYSVLVLIFKYSYFSTKIPHFIYFCIFGFLLNAAIIFAALFFLWSNKLSKKLLNIILKILSKVKIIKNVKAAEEKFAVELESFHEGSEFLYKNIKMCIFTSLLTFLQWTAYYSIPYFIYRSFGFYGADLVTLISAHVFLTMFMSCIPLPGAEGGAEGGFYLIFGLFFKSNTIVSAIFIWRILIYYSVIAIGGLFSIILPDKHKKPA